MSGPAISDEMVEAFARGFNACPSDDTGRHPMCCTRAGLAAALVASGYRPEGDVLRESGSRWLDMAADANWLKTWLSAHGLGVDAGSACVLAAVGRDFLAYSTKFRPLEPALPLPVADGSDADSVENRVEYGAVHGTCEHWGSWPTAQSLISWLSEHHPDWRPLIRVTSGAGLKQLRPTPVAADPTIDEALCADGIHEADGPCCAGEAAGR